MGFAFVSLSSTALIGVDDRDAGVASALVNTTQQVGGSLGTALLNTIFTTVFAGYLVAHGTSALNQANGAIHGYNVAFLVSAILMAASAVVVFVFVQGKSKTTGAAGETVATGEVVDAVPAHIG